MSIESTKNWVIVKNAAGGFIGKLDETKSTPETIVLDPTYEFFCQHQMVPNGQNGVQLAPLKAIIPMDLGTSAPLTEHPRASSILYRLSNLSEKDRQMYVKQIEAARQSVSGTRGAVALINPNGMPIA